MEKLTVGSVVLVTFPFSNLKGQKVRPALVVACVEFENCILCQITSKPYSSTSAIVIELSDFSHGSLPVKSYARPDKIFTADPAIIKKKIANLKPGKKKIILRSVRALFAE